MNSFNVLIKFTCESFSVADNILTLDFVSLGSIGYLPEDFTKILASFSFSNSISRQNLILNLLLKPTIFMNLRYENSIASSRSKSYKFSKMENVPLLGENATRIGEVYNFLCVLLPSIKDIPGFTDQVYIDSATMYGDDLSSVFSIHRYRMTGDKAYLDTVYDVSADSPPLYPLNKYVIRMVNPIFDQIKNASSTQEIYINLKGLGEGPLVNGTKPIVTSDLPKLSFGPWEDFTVTFHRHSVDSQTYSLYASNSIYNIFECDLGSGSTVSNVDTSINAVAEVTGETFLWTTSKWKKNDTGKVDYNKRVPACILSTEKITPMRFPQVIDLNTHEKLNIEICHSTEFDIDEFEEKREAPSNEWFVLITFACSSDNFWQSEEKISLIKEDLNDDDSGKLYIYKDVIDLTNVLAKQSDSTIETTESDRIIKSQYINIALAKEEKDSPHIVSSIYFAKIYLG